MKKWLRELSNSAFLKTNSIETFIRIYIDTVYNFSYIIPSTSQIANNV